MNILLLVPVTQIIITILLMLAAYMGNRQKRMPKFYNIGYWWLMTSLGLGVIGWHLALVR